MAKIQDLDDLARQRGFRDGADFLTRTAKRLSLVRRLERRGEIEARLDWGRWLADCPFCGGAERVSRQAREFYCLSCGNADNEGYPMTATFPGTVEEIEAELEREPVKFQNWNRERGAK